MAFFDFLTDDEDEAKKKKPPPNVVDQLVPDGSTEQPGRLQVSGAGLGIMEPPNLPIDDRLEKAYNYPTKEQPKDASEKLAFAKKRAAAKDFALKQANKAIDALEKLNYGGPPEANPAIVLRARLMQEQPENYARIIERALPDIQPGGIPVNKKAILQGVEEAVRAFKNLQKESDGALSMIPGYVNPHERPQVEQKLKQLDQIEANMRATLVDAVSDREQKELEEQLKQLKIQKDILKAKLPSAIPPDAGATIPQSETITGAAKAAGVPEQDFQDGIEEIAKKLGLNLDEEVQFPLALQRLLNSPEFADVRPDFEAIGGSGQMGPPASAAPNYQGGEGKEKAPAPVDLHAEEKALLTKISATKDINTWYEAIAFVLLSMLIKPQMAILFFSRASERGQLKADLVENRRKQKIRAEEKQAAAARAEWTRRTAVEATLRHAERQDEKKQEFVRNWFLLRERAHLFKKAPKDDIAAQLQKDFDNWSGMAAKAGQSMQYDRAEIYMDKADAILKQMEDYQRGKTQVEEPAP